MIHIICGWPVAIKEGSYIGHIGITHVSVTTEQMAKFFTYLKSLNVTLKVI